MKIEVWTDLICPWCYIGKRRLDRAIEGFQGRSDVSITWRSFELDPGFPSDFSGSVDELLVQKYGMSLADARAAHERLRALALEEGLRYDFARARPANTRRAHRLLHFAAAQGVGADMQERLMHGYFCEGLAVSDADALVRVASELGLDPEACREALESAALDAEVAADERRARELGLRGVPAFLFDGRLLVSGAQSSEVLSAALAQALETERGASAL